MAIIIAALCLPYTAGFFHKQTLSTEETITSSHSEQNHTSSPESESESEESNSQTDSSPSSRPFNSIHGRSRSLQLIPTFMRSTASLTLPTSLLMPQTPGATTNTDSIFRPQNQAVPLSMALPDRGLVRNKSAASLQTLSALDAQTSTWGNVPHLNQPRSMAIPPPSRQIEDVGLEENVEELSIGSKVDKLASRSRSEDGIEYSIDNYSILPTTLGNAGLYAAILGLTSKGHIKEKTWIGTLGMPTDALSQEVKEHMEGKLLVDHDCVAVYVNDTAMNGHYENYCKTILWPTFHSQIPIQPDSKAYEENTWSHYMAVNQAFADKIVDSWKQDDIVWIHDYHLLLVPGLVRQKLPNAKIGLFIHAAFPPSEVFRILPSRYDLIAGMLGANLIAFQTKDFRDHFLQTCTRLLNLISEGNGLILDNGRFIDILTIPMGIDLDAMNARRQLPMVTDDIESFMNQFKDKYIIFARDKLDPISGLKHKLRGYENFLKRYPEWKHKVVLVQVVPYTSQAHTLRYELQDLIEGINRQFGAGPFNYQPINYWTVDLDYSQYLALLSVADCMLITSLCEGMNLTCHEFVACQDGVLGTKGFAPIVLSQFAGAAEVFGDNALLVNPWHPRAIADQLNEALKRSVKGNKDNWTKMYALIQKHSALSWYESFVADLERAWEGQYIRDSANVPRLQILPLREKYQHARKRLLIIDFEGTLTTWNASQEEIITTPKRVTDVLNELVDDENNIIYIASQRPKGHLEHMLRMVPKVGLIAENGAFIRKQGHKNWVTTVDLDLSQWFAGIKAMLQSSASIIPGSRIVEMDSGLIFQYDSSQSSGHAGNMTSRINNMCKDQNVEAYPFETGLYVHDRSINKSLACRNIVKDFMNDDDQLDRDLVLVVGDSEDTFRWARSLEVENVMTCVVGKRHTDAAFNLGSMSAVLSTLEKMIKSDTA